MGQHGECWDLVTKAAIARSLWAPLSSIGVARSPIGVARSPKCDRMPQCDRMPLPGWRRRGCTRQHGAGRSDTRRWSGLGRGLTTGPCHRLSVAFVWFAYIVGWCQPSPWPDYGDKRARNKRFGPGGGTRRLHHDLYLGFCRLIIGHTTIRYSGAETGSTNV